MNLKTYSIVTKSGLVIGEKLTIHDLGHILARSTSAGVKIKLCEKTGKEQRSYIYNRCGEMLEVIEN